MSEGAHFAIIGLGSNLGDREGRLRQAIEHLSPWLDNIKESAVYASPAMLPYDAPKEWDVPFLNMAICGQTALSAEALLEHIRDIEQSMGRNRIGHWGPREIDIDILAYDQQIIDSENLRVPHPGMLERPFVLMPMRDIAAHWGYPRSSMHQGKTIDEIGRELLKNEQQCTLHLTKLPASEDAK